MTVVPNLPSATPAEASDVIPISQSGTLNSAPVSTLLSDTLLFLPDQTVSTVLAGPSTGAPMLPTFRPLIGTDLPAATNTVRGAVSLGGVPQPSNDLSELSATAATARGNPDLGSIATQGANAIVVTGGTISGADLSLSTSESSDSTTAMPTPAYDRRAKQMLLNQIE